MSLLSAAVIAASITASTNNCYETWRVPTPKYVSAEDNADAMRDYRQRVIDYMRMTDVALDVCARIFNDMHKRVLEDRAYDSAIRFNRMVRQSDETSFDR